MNSFRAVYFRVFRIHGAKGIISRVVKGTICTSEKFWVGKFAVGSFMFGCTFKAYRVTTARGTGMIVFLTVITLFSSIKFVCFNSYDETKEFFDIKNSSKFIRREDTDKQNRKWDFSFEVLKLPYRMDRAAKMDKFLFNSLEGYLWGYLLSGFFWVFWI